MLDRCVEYDEDRKICIAHQNGKKYTLNNDGNYRIRKVRVDGCLPQSVNEQRCDFLMHAVRNEENKAIFIELKGGALSDAVKQVSDTIAYVKHELQGSKMCVRIVGTSDVPNIVNSPGYKKLSKEVNGNIKRATNRVLIENIENI